MTTPPDIRFETLETKTIPTLEGRLAVFLGGEGGMDAAARRVNTRAGGALARLAAAKSFQKMKQGEAHLVSFPGGLAAEAVIVVKLDKSASQPEARKAGAAIARLRGDGDLHVVAGTRRRVADMSLGLALRAYDFRDHKTGDDAATPGAVTFHVSKPATAEAEARPLAAAAAGVFFTRDLVNEPANILTTNDFAEKLTAMRDLGLAVTVLEEADLETLGMRALLGVGQGSDSPTKVVIMEWKGGGSEAPFALIGKGVVFDTGGISLKPAGGMEDMTMDMGGAGVVAGVMRTLALRGAKANVVGLVGLVENMPDGKAQRPGDVVTSMKGDTIEVINTDAEGRLVLADVMWYAQETFKPSGMIDLATLTGAMIIALGHEYVGAFSNSDELCAAFLKSAAAEGENAWRMPLHETYDKQLKSRVADMMNVGGRPAGSITAAQFLKRFVKDETPWIHLDIAGVASLKTDSGFAPKGATGWGVLALDRLIRDRYED